MMSLRLKLIPRRIGDFQLSYLKSSERYQSTIRDSWTELRKKSNFLYSQEQKRQYESIGRIEKIEVTVQGPSGDTVLSMNKDISTPYDCTRHLSQSVIERSALSLVDGESLWDMHRPLTKDCTLKLLTFKDDEPHLVNKAYWRTCSLVLGAVVCNSFKNNIQVSLHSFPPPNVKSGSFVYDVELSILDWTATVEELKVLSSEMIKIAQAELPIECLSVAKDLALEIFDGNHFKQEQIPQMAAQSENNKVTLYRVGEHIDVSRGPMISSTAFIGRCSVTAVHKINTEYGELYRFQGVSIPKGIMLNHFAFSILEDRAKNMNQGRVPGVIPTSITESEAAMV